MMDDKDFVYSRIGMALASAQRVEYVTNELVVYLKKYDKKLFGIMSESFMENTPDAHKLRKHTLGQIFRLLKLNPKLVLEDELDNYLKLRNILVHNFWRQYLNEYSPQQTKRAIDFLYDFGRFSDRIESFFKGFLYLLAMGLAERNPNHPIPEDMKREDFDYFIDSLECGYLS